ncbi:MAG: prepilin-type N-terminal cleavage/methylation domain-containing protein [Armatimonadetes bacterium]|nr:prepilin-type N-terminal cleavage/methylation domain-containing protein [Armatimonadota bacterium]
MSKSEAHLSLIRRRGGFSLIEVIVASGLLVMVLVGTVALFGSTSRLWRIGTSGTTANMYGSLAMRKIATEMQEGQSAYEQNGHLFVQFPRFDSYTGSYQRTVAGDLVEYYLSGDNGTESPVENGDNTLWKRVDGSRTRLASHLRSFEFSLSGTTMVRLAMRGVESENVGINPDLIQQSVSLRNR